MFLEAVEDVNLNSLVLSSMQFTGNSKNNKFDLNQSLIKSDTKVGGHLVLDVGGDMNVVGSDLTVENGTVGSIGGDLNVISQDTSSMSVEKRTETSGSLFTKADTKSLSIDNETKQHGSAIELGLSSQLDVDGEALIAGSQVSGGDISLNAKKGLYVMSMHDEKQSLKNQSKSYMLANKQALDQRYDRTVVKGGLTAAGKLNVHSSDGEVMIMGSDILGGNGMNIHAKEGISFINDLDISESHQERVKVNF